MTQAEQAAVERFPHGKYDGEQGDALRYACIAGYNKAEKDTIAIIESRLSELLGDAQPTPILRCELQDLIKKIKEIEQ